MSKLREAAAAALEAIEDSGCKADLMAAADALRAALAEPTGKDSLQVEPAAWSCVVEHRLLTWRQRFVNRSGDQLALDDFMDQQSFDDLIDYVCDEYTHPAPQRQPLTREEIRRIVNQTVQGVTLGESVLFLAVARAIEKAHGIGGQDE